MKQLFSFGIFFGAGFIGGSLLKGVLFFEEEGTNKSLRNSSAFLIGSSFIIPNKIIKKGLFGLGLGLGISTLLENKKK